MTPAIKVVLMLPEEKVKKEKPMEPFQKNFATYVAANIKNGINIVIFFRDGKDPIQALEEKYP